MLTMSSEANREYVRDTVQYYVGDDVVVKESGGKDNVVRGVPEVEMREDIKKRLNMDVPVFQYKPEEMEFIKYEVYDKDRTTLIYYTIDGEKVVLCISEKAVNKHNMKGYDGKLINTISGEYDTFLIDIFKDVDKNSNQKGYSARWERNDVNYRLSGSVEKKEFYKILKKMSF